MSARSVNTSLLPKGPEPMSAPLSDRSAIEARGQIQLGKRCLLMERPRAVSFPPFTYSAFRPADGTVAAVDMPPVATPGELPTQQLDWLLKTTDADLCITDAGLRGSYGIFGASGSGKTPRAPPAPPAARALARQAGP